MKKPYLSCCLGVIPEKKLFCFITNVNVNMDNLLNIPKIFTENVGRKRTKLFRNKHSRMVWDETKDEYVRNFPMEKWKSKSVSPSYGMGSS